MISGVTDGGQAGEPSPLAR